MMTRKEIENLLIEYGKLMWQKNYTPGTSGNMSLNMVIRYLLLLLEVQMVF